MGGGGLRILGHKKWHVWRRENIERVYRDEREHAEAQEQHKLEQRRIEQERRIEQLQSASAPPAANVVQQQEQHVNLFPEAAAAGRRDEGRPRKDGRRDTKPQVQETLKRQGVLPWYAKSARDTDQQPEQAPATRKERKRKRALEEQDPLLNMRPPSSPDRHPSAPRTREERGHRSRRKHKHSEPRTGSSSAEEESAYVKKKTSKHSSKKQMLLEELRREREKREKAERARAEALFGTR